MCKSRIDSPSMSGCHQTKILSEHYASWSLRLVQKTRRGHTAAMLNTCSRGPSRGWGIDCKLKGENERNDSMLQSVKCKDSDCLSCDCGLGDAGRISQPSPKQYWLLIDCRLSLQSAFHSLHELGTAVGGHVRRSGVDEHERHKSQAKLVRLKENQILRPK